MGLHTCPRARARYVPWDTGTARAAAGGDAVVARALAAAFGIDGLYGAGVPAFPYERAYGYAFPVRRPFDICVSPCICISHMGHAFDICLSECVRVRYTFYNATPPVPPPVAGGGEGGMHNHMGGGGRGDGPPLALCADGPLPYAAPNAYSFPVYIT